MKLEVGKTYINSINEKVTIIAKPPQSDYYIGEVKGQCIRKYKETGVFVPLNEKRPFSDGLNLIKEYREPQKFETEIYCLSKLPIGTVSTLITYGHWYGHPDRVGEFTKFRVIFEEIIE